MNRVVLDEASLATQAEATDLVALDGALKELEAVDPTGARIVMLRYFVGMTVPETADVMDIAPRTVDRYWRHARAWLRRRVDGGSDDER